MMRNGLPGVLDEKLGRTQSLSRRSLLRGVAASSLYVTATGGLAVACGSGTGSNSGKDISMTVANATSNDTQERLAQKFTDLVTARSNGHIKGELHSSGALGDNTEVLRGLQSGAIQATINPTAFLGKFVPTVAILELPWLYPGNSFEGVIRNQTRILQGDAGKKIREQARAQGFQVVSLFGLSPQLIFGTEAIEGLNALKGKKFRTAPGKVHINTFRNWGALAVAMPFAEVYTSLQQGVIDGVEDPPDVSLKMGFHEVAPYVAVTKHAAFASYLAVSKVWYQGLPSSLREVIDEAGAEIERLGTEWYVKSEVAALNKLEENPKVTVTDFPPEDLARMQQLNKAGIWQEIRSDPQKAPLLELLLKDIEELAK